MKEAVKRIQKRVRAENYGMDIHYYIDSDVLKDLYLEYGGELENVFEDEYDEINEVYDIKLSPEGVLTFIQHNQVGYSYDTPSFGYSETTSLEDLIKDLDNYVSGNLSKILTQDNINELIIVGSIGDEGSFADDMDVALFDFYYSKETGFQNQTKFIRYVQYDDTRIEFNSTYDISLLTYSDEFDDEEGTLTFQGIELVEILDSWVVNPQKIQKIETLEVESTVILSFGKMFDSFSFHIATNAISSNSNIREIYVDSNIDFEDDFIEPEGNENIVFYIVNSNVNAIKKIQNSGFEVIPIIKDDFPTYEGDFSETSKTKPANNKTKNTILKNDKSVNEVISPIVISESSNELEELTGNDLRENKINLKPIIFHYFLLPINVFLPWSIVSWVGIPLAIYARNRLDELRTNEIEFPKAHVAWTNIAIGVFVFYLLISLLRSAIL